MMNHYTTGNSYLVIRNGHMGFFNPQDHYFKEAKKAGYKARSAFKLDEINQKYHIFDKNVKTVLDIGCAPGSWLQYSYDKLSHIHKPKSAPQVQPDLGSGSREAFTVIGLDIQDVALTLPGVYTYKQDIQDIAAVKSIIAEHGIQKFDAIISDMAPNTIGFRDVDAIRSIELLRTTLPLYENFLKTGGKAVIKIFMGPGFDEFIQEFKKLVGGKNVKTLKPQAVRKESKEIYIVKF